MSDRVNENDPLGEGTSRVRMDISSMFDGNRINLDFYGYPLEDFIEAFNDMKNIDKF